MALQVNQIVKKDLKHTNHHVKAREGITKFTGMYEQASTIYFARLSLSGQIPTRATRHQRMMQVDIKRKGGGVEAVCNEARVKRARMKGSL